MRIDEPVGFKQFLMKWLEWAEGDAVEGEPFSREFGLCTNFHGFWEQGDKNRTFYVYDFMKYIHGGDYPFGDEFEEDCHLNPKRIAWVKEYLNET